MKFFKKILIYLPVIFIILLSVLKWYFPDRKIEIFLFLSGFSLVLGLALLFISKFRYKVKSKSIGGSILSLLSMQNVAGIALIIAMVLAFSWLIDYLREFPEWDQIEFLSLAGATFSLMLIFLIASIVIFIEKQKLSKLKFSDPAKPLKTKGLIITLSRFSPLFKMEEFTGLIDQINFKEIDFDYLFNQVKELKSNKRMSHLKILFKKYKNDEILFKFFSKLESSPLYPPLVAVNYHIPKLRRLWILVSREAEESTLPVFLKLCELTIPDWQKINIKKEFLDQPENVKYVSMIVSSIYYHLPEEQELGEHEITSDITGGPASVTAGIVLACVRSKRRVQYLSQNDYRLKAIDVNVANIPELFDEMVEQIEVMRARETAARE